MKRVRSYFPKVYHALNFAGLSVCLATCLYIFIYVHDEFSYDRFHRDADQIYRVALTLKFGQLDVFQPMASPPLSSAMQREIPEVQDAIRLYGLEITHSFRRQELAFTEKRVLYADSNFFSFFTFPLVEGDPATALRNPQTIVLTEALAVKYFGSTKCVGDLLVVDGETYSVTGVTRQPPEASTIAFDALLSMSSQPLALSTTWMGNRFFTYVKLVPGANAKEADMKLDDLVLKHIGPDLQRSLGISLQTFLQQKNTIGYDLHPLSETHLVSHYRKDMTPASDIRYIYMFGAVGLALFLIACFNFINLSTSQFIHEVRSMALRKTLGADRVQLITAMGKKVLKTTSCAAGISLLILYLLLPSINRLSGKALSANILIQPSILAALVVMVLTFSLLSSLYPAIYLTSFSPGQALRGQVTNRGGQSVRTGLVLLQQIFSTGSIVFTLVMLSQMDFVLNHTLGFKKEGVIALRNTDRIGNNANSLKDALLRESAIVAASFTDRLVFDKMSGEAVREPNQEQSHILNFYVSDEDQLKTMEFKLIAGRFFSRDFLSDSNAVVINEEAYRELGWTSVDNKELAADDDIRFKVVGVVNNFNYESLRNEIRPLIIFYSANTAAVLNIRFANLDAAEVVQLLQDKWSQYGNGEPFEYTFLDQDFDALFKTESRSAGLLTLFSGLIIFVSCLGLFSLSYYTAEKRTREFGIRKVLGSTNREIALLMVRQFAMLTLYAALIAAVPTYYLSKGWLDGFAYKYTITQEPFVVAIVISLVLSGITVAFHSLRAAFLSPVEALRSE